MDSISFFGKIISRLLEPLTVSPSSKDMGWVSSSLIGNNQPLESKDSEFFGITSTLRLLFQRKSTEEIEYERRRKKLEERLRDALAATGEYDISDLELSRLSDGELLNVINHLKYHYDYFDLVQDYYKLNSSSRLLTAITKRIGRLLTSTKKYLRNLKHAFKRYHSFHFKNLDDCHPLSLVNEFV